MERRHATYETVTKGSVLRAHVEAALRCAVCCLDTETTSTDEMTAELVGISLAYGPDTAIYIPVGHTTVEGKLLPGQLGVSYVLEQIERIASSAKVKKVFHNAAYDLVVLKRYGIPGFRAVEDTLLMAYAMRTDDQMGGLGMKALSIKHLDYRQIEFDDVVRPALGHQDFSHADIRDATAYSAEDVDVTLRLYEHFSSVMTAEQTRIYEQIDRPLPGPVVAMKMQGVKVDVPFLNDLTAGWVPELEELQQTINAAAGWEVNLGSPAQLQKLLFEQWGLQPAGQTDSGANSTDADALKTMVDVKPEVKLIARWKELSKLVGTYTVGLPEKVNTETGRVHCSIGLTGTRTSRLTASDPNLNNIPTRTKDGELLRKAFVEGDGYRLISADYSQIEYRLLAHISQEPVFLKAFLDGVDVHALTASKVFRVPIEYNTDPKTMKDDPFTKAFKKLRSKAKTVNFGLLYGQTAYGLAAELSVDEDEAQDFIDDYFRELHGLESWMIRTKGKAAKDGGASDLFGRWYGYADLKSPQEWKRKRSERQVCNALVQGAAAGLFRLAMARVHRALRAGGFDAQLLVPVHDELLVRVHEDQVDDVKACVVENMEQAAEPFGIEWSVPIISEAKAGDSWYDAK